MKKNKIVLLAIGAAVMLGNTSCRKELLTPIPQTSVADVSAFSTSNRVVGQLNGIYSALKGGTFYGGRYIIYGDIRGEDFLNETGNLVTGSDVWANNPTNSTSAVTNIWSQAYYTINSANIFLEGMAGGGTAVVGSALAANYIAEAKFIRALTYFSLLQYYARPYADGNGNKPGVPLRLAAVKGTGQSAIARSTVAEVYTQILADLNDAEAGLPLTYSSATLNTTRAHRNTAIALKVRVYLTMQRYADVITEANKIVSSAAPFTAATGVTNSLQANIANVFTSYTTTESIFSLPMTTTAGDYPGTQNQLAYYFSPTTANGGVGNGEFSLNPAGIIGDSTWKSTTDARRAFVVKSGTGTNTRYWLTKYKVASPYTDWAPVIRYPEVMLSLVEARARSTNSVDAQAVALLNAVRRRSDATVTYTAASFASVSALIDGILKERRIEFLGEGLRNNDLMRLLQTIPAKGTAQAKTPSDNGYIWPISANELSLNPLMTDN